MTCPTRRVAPYAAGVRLEPRARGGAVDLLDAGRRVLEARGLDGADPTPVQHPGDAVDVVGVEVREHQQRDVGDAEPAQAAVDRGRVGPGVHDHAGAAAGVQDERVALADVARDQHPARGRPARRGHADQGSGDEQRAAGQPRPPPAQQPWPEQGHRHRQRGEQHQRQHAGPPVERGGGQGGATPGDQDDPGDAPRRERAGHRPGGRPDQAGQGARQTEHRRRPDDRADQQVRQHRDHADLPGDGRDQRRAGQLGGRRNGDRLGQPAGQPPGQGVAPRRREQQDPGGRQHRQREPERGRQGGLHQQQHHDREPEGPAPPLPAVAAHREQRHRAHDRGAQHARLGAGEQHEPGDAQRTDRGEPPPPDPAPSAPAPPRTRRAGSGSSRRRRAGGSGRWCGSRWPGPRRRPRRRRPPAPAPAPAARPAGGRPRTAANGARRRPRATRLPAVPGSPARRSGAARRPGRCPGPVRGARWRAPAHRAAAPTIRRRPGPAPAWPAGGCARGPSPGAP